MHVIVEQYDDVVVLELEIDHLDSGNFAALKEEIEANTADRTRVVLDLHNLRFVDSAGLGAILSILRRLGERGGTLKIAEVSRPVEQLFNLVRLPRIIDMYPRTQDAVRAFKA
jgi:anti-sigma B factor antagonist